MYARVFSSICQPTEQTRASSVPIICQPLKGIFRRNPSPRVWEETCNVMKVINLIQSWCKSAALYYTRVTLRMVMVLVLATVKRPPDLNLLRITPMSMWVTADSVTFQPMFWAKNALLYHPYGPTVTLRRSKDECLCQVALVKEYIARTRTESKEVKRSL